MLGLSEAKIRDIGDPIRDILLRVAIDEESPLADEYPHLAPLDLLAQALAEGQADVVDLRIDVGQRALGAMLGADGGIIGQVAGLLDGLLGGGIGDLAGDLLGGLGDLLGIGGKSAATAAGNAVGGVSAGAIATTAAGAALPFAVAGGLSYGGEWLFNALGLDGDEQLLSAARAHEDYVSGETLATSVSYGPDGTEETATIEGRELRISVERV